MARRAEEYLNAHYTNVDLRISQVAEVCGVSEVYLRRLFEAVYQCSPIAYVRARRMARAKELIASGFYSMCEAVECAGYGSYSYFCREFKKETGQSPCEYARGVQKV